MSENDAEIDRERKNDDCDCCRQRGQKPTIPKSERLNLQGGDIGPEAKFRGPPLSSNG